MDPNINLPKFIILSGKRCSGKDTACDIIKKYIKIKFNVDYESISFANEVKHKVAEYYNLDYNRLLYDYDYKQQHRDKLISYSWKYKKDYGQDIWVNYLIQHCDPEKYYIITDARFPYEIDYFHDNKKSYLTIRINTSDDVRKKSGFIYNDKYDTEDSEVLLDNYNFNLIINNNIYDIEQYKKKIIDSLLLKILSKSEIYQF